MKNPTFKTDKMSVVIATWGEIKSTVKGVKGETSSYCLEEQPVTIREFLLGKKARQFFKRAFAARGQDDMLEVVISKFEKAAQKAAEQEAAQEASAARCIEEKEQQRQALRLFMKNPTPEGWEEVTETLTFGEVVEAELPLRMTCSYYEGMRHTTQKGREEFLHSLKEMKEYKELLIKQLEFLINEENYSMRKDSIFSNKSYGGHSVTVTLSKKTDYGIPVIRVQFPQMG